MKVQNTSFILDELYPLVESKLKNTTIKNKFIRNITDFFNRKHSQLYDIAPYTNIYYNKTDLDSLFKSIDITEKEVEDILRKCFFWDISYRPKAAKEPYVEMLMCCIRYFLKNKNDKEAELTTIYLCFTGKLYASIYSNYWQFPVNPSIMDYVINNMLTDKYDLKKEGTLFNAIRKLVRTWIGKYEKDIVANKISDDEFGKFIQQIRDRERSFLLNIFILYKDAATNKTYLNYETDNLDPDEFRITDNDSAKASRITNAAIDILTSKKVNMQYCYNAQDQRVKASQIKVIMEDIILADSNNIPGLRRVINIMICDFLAGSDKPINSVAFYSYAIAAKPNTKNKLIIEMNTTILGWLNQDATYRARSHNAPTANSYKRAILAYLAQVIIKASTK
jgi:hypothetical protein